MSSEWEEIGGFHSQREFERFLSWIEELVVAGVAEEVPVGSKFQGIQSIPERWFLNGTTDDVWRLVWPDAPFAGVFSKVVSDEPTGLQPAY